MKKLEKCDFFILINSEKNVINTIKIIEKNVLC